MLRHMAVEHRESGAEGGVPSPIVFPEGIGGTVLDCNICDLPVGGKQRSEAISVRAVHVTLQGVDVDALAHPGGPGGPQGVVEAVEEL